MSQLEELNMRIKELENENMMLKERLSKYDTNISQEDMEKQFMDFYGQTYC